MLLFGYCASSFRDFESYLRLFIGLDEQDIQLILKEYNSHFITYQLTPGIYTIQDISDAIETFSGHEQSFFHTLIGFSPYWDYKPNNSNHVLIPGVYPSDKIILNINRIDKIHLKCDAIDGSIQDGVRQPILFSFVLDKPSGYKVFCEPETFHYKKINKSVLNTITFYLEDDNNREVDFNGETLTFTLQMIKI